MNMPLALLNRRRRIGGFSPSALFALAEPGVWFDPSDVANLNWRRNLLTWTEQFDNAAWVKGNATVTSNTSVAPDGTSTADRLVENTASATTHSASQTYTAASGTAVAFSVYLKAGERSWARVTVNTASGANASAYFDVSAGVVGSIAGGNASIQSVGNGWYRCTVSGTLSTTNPSCSVLLATADGGQTYTGDGTSGILIWGAQLELGSVATDYQRITDVNTEVIERFPTATLYQDTAGTTPVTTTGQSVGLMLDKSKGLVLGANVATVSSVTGVAIGGPSFTNYTISPAMVAGRTYEISFTVSGYSGSGDVGIAGGAAGFEPDLSSHVRSSDGIVRVIGIAATATAIQVYTRSTNTANFSNISVKELPGNHAVQATTANRPIYGIHPFGGRRNLLVRTEEFENAAWTKQNCTILTNTATAPDGTSTADKIQETAVTAAFSVGVAPTMALSTTHTLSVYMKAAERSFGVLNIFTGAASCWTWYDLASGTVGTVGSGATASISSVGNGWYRCVLTIATAASGSPNVAMWPATANNTLTYAGTLGSGILIWGAQLETGSTATAYQRVTDQYNVTEAGVSSVSYLFFDGVNDSLATPSINFPAGPTNPTLGAELVTNGDFSSGTTGWITTSWVISGGKATISNVSDSLAQNVTLTAGKAYRVEYTLSGFSGTGAFRPRFFGGTTVTGTSRSADGTYVEIMTAVTGNTQAALSVTTATCSGSVDNISVREIDAAQAPDKMTVFAGVRKLSDAATAILLESSTTLATNNGAFQIGAPITAGAANYNFNTKGTGPSGSTYTDAAVAAPVTSVLAAIGDIANDVSLLRVNGTQVAQNTADQGTGTYLAYPLFVGARAGASLFFSGHIYSLIVRGAQSNTGQISSTETWVAGKTGITI